MFRARGLKSHPDGLLKSGELASFEALQVVSGCWQACFAGFLPTLPTGTRHSGRAARARD